ncbi:polynucleotide adenylyltransferase PcnB [Myxococcota bacterium]|nr:polynucleotide adenylyltransferase PcnB [Myxococcota bacterium]MBU1537363.1 polynucleotide adenylyltransferase PcnB [Myxococcota bacterium]
MTLQIPRELIDPDAVKVVRRLNRNNYLAYLVGGSVRDLLIGRRPKDFDLVTDARPSEIRKIFRNSRIIGRRFKLAHIYFGNDKILETSTFRAQPVPREEDEDLLIVSDNLFGTPEEDARRRDFTVNGLFYDVAKGEIIDYVHGLRDITHRSIKTIGDPDVRFQEDPVRIVRALRFAGKLGFTLESETEKFLKIHSETLMLSSRRRLVDEIWKTIHGGAVSQTLPLMMHTGVLQVLLPELDERLKERGNFELLMKSCSLIDLFHQHPLMSLSLTGPVFFQFWIEELLVPQRVNGNQVSKVYKENLQPLLVTYGFSRAQRDAIHRILQIIAQIGYPSASKKIPPKVVGKDLFWPAYLIWQILWFSRGVIPRLDLTPFFRPLEDLLPWDLIRRPGGSGGGRGVTDQLNDDERLADEDMPAGQVKREVPQSRRETPGSRRARSRSHSRRRTPRREAAKDET